MDLNFSDRHRHCNFLDPGSGHDDRQISQGCEVNLSLVTLLVRPQEAGMGELTPEETVAASTIEERSRR